MSNLEIPASLDLRIPEVRARHDQALKDWKPGTVKNTKGKDVPRVEYDRKGRSLPAGIDDVGRAMLKAQEREESTETKVRLAELTAKAAEARAAKRALRDAADDAAAKRKR